MYSHTRVDKVRFGVPLIDLRLEGSSPPAWVSATSLANLEHLSLSPTTRSDSRLHFHLSSQLASSLDAAQTLIPAKAVCCLPSTEKKWKEKQSCPSAGCNIVCAEEV